MPEKESQTIEDVGLDTIIDTLEAKEVSKRNKWLAAINAYFGSIPLTKQPVAPVSGHPDASRQPALPSPSVPKDIRTLKEEKNPKSNIEMVAVMAYYLNEVAPPHERKESVSAGDIETYFKQAYYKIPKVPTQTLVDAKNAGYFESPSHGQYRLNPVGHNLVVHSLPRSSVESTRRNRKSKK